MEIFPQRTYICIDLKSYYASVECVHRGLDPLKANLLVADESRSDQTICLAVSPSLKAMGVPSRPRLFEAKWAIRKYEREHNTKVEYITAVPRMAEYERISAQIYGIYLRYVAPEDVHVYSIDECFIDCTQYLHFYKEEALRANVDPAHVMAMTMIRDVLATTGMSLAMSMLVFSVSFPINVKFGHVKGQMVRMAVIMVMVLCGMAIINYGGPVLGMLVKAGPMILPAGAALVLLIYFCSWLLSVRIYERKDL